MDLIHNINWSWGTTTKWDTCGTVTRGGYKEGCFIPKSKNEKRKSHLLLFVLRFYVYII
jgi:hypothetical protein